MEVNTVKKRRLSDLYRRGKELTLDDGDGGVTVYLQKLNPLESETIVRKANAARTAFMLARKDETSEEYLAAYGDLDTLEQTALLDFVVTDELAQYSLRIEAELAEAEGSEWAKDDYLQSLYDAWEGGLEEDAQSEDPSPEALRVQSELERFQSQVQTRIEAEGERIRGELEKKDESSLRILMRERMDKMQGDLQWILEYRKWEVYFGTRDPENHAELYFEDKEEVDALELSVIQKLVEAFAELNVEVDQGKDSEATATSSSPSSSPETPETTSSSTPQE